MHKKQGFFDGGAGILTFTNFFYFFYFIEINFDIMGQEWPDYGSRH